MKRSVGKIRKRVVKGNAKQYTYFVLDFGRVDGKRKFLNFRTLAEAKLALEHARIERNKIGQDAIRLTDRDRQDAARAKHLSGGAVNLEAAMDFYIKHHGAELNAPSVSDVIKELLSQKSRLGRRPRTLANLKCRLGHFAATFGEAKVTSITTRGLEQWIHSLGVGARSQIHYRTVVSGLFNYALKRGYANQNPALAVEKPRMDPKLPEFLTVDEVKRLMDTAIKISPEMVPYFAIATFAGIRPTEISRLDWRHIDLEKKLIRITGEAAKTRSQRFVEISENLAAWLTPYKQASGLLYCSRKKFEQVRRLAKVAWCIDILRHTFATYHLAAYENAAKTAFLMGHRGLDMLYGHYRGLATRAEAARFWAIYPST
jgi:integrase